MKNFFILVLALLLISPTFGAAKPDLKVVSLTATPLQGGRIRVAYTVKNIGQAASNPSITRVTVSTTGIKEIQQNTPALKPGEDITKNVEYTIGKNGNYQFKVTADYLKQIPENNERNNENKIQFGLSRKI